MNTFMSSIPEIHENATLESSKKSQVTKNCQGFLDK